MKIPSKEDLDLLLDKYKAQPVGHGYIDIIVSRDNYKEFAKALIYGGFRIDAVSWWEYLPSHDMETTYGMGGPRSLFYSGWFAETSTELDDIVFTGNPESNLNVVINLVENKVLGIGYEKKISYQETPTLTPAFWLKVDESWRNDK
jgi:hypothetical protein